MKSKEDFINFISGLLKDIPKEDQENHLNSIKNISEEINNFENKNNIYKTLKKEEKKLKKDFKKLIIIFKETINFQAELSRHLLLSREMGLNMKYWDTMPLLHSSYLKNLTTFISILELIEKNLWGPARMLIRNLFESLLLSKYCFITKNQKLFERWDSGDHINITFEVINKIQDNKELIEFKNTLNKYTHFSVYSNQGTWEYDSTQTKLTFFYLYLMLQMNFTMYHRYLINNNSVKESIIRYLGFDKLYFYDYIYSNTKDNLIKLKKIFIKTDKSKKLFKELEKNWKINTKDLNIKKDEK